MVKSFLSLGSAPIIATILANKNNPLNAKNKKTFKLEYLDQNICILSTNLEKISHIEIKCSPNTITVCAYSGEPSHELVDMFLLTSKTLNEFIRIFYEFIFRFA